MPDSTQRTQLLHAASFVPIGAFAGKPAMPLTRPVLVIGSGPHARFLLKSDTVSTSHTLLIHTAAGWYLRDLVSRTHTILNGKSVRESPVHNGDTLTIGKFVFHCAIDGAPAEFTPVAPAALEITDAEIPVPVDTRTVLIGRRVGCEVRLIEESVSLVHAVLFEADGKHYVRDLYSRTGTFVNGQKVHEAPLAFGDVIVVGETTIRYIADAAAGELSTAVATDLSAHLSTDATPDLVELEPFGVTEPARTTNRTTNRADELLTGSLGGSVGDLLAPPTIDPASLVPLTEVPPASSVATAAGVALSEIPPARDEIERPDELALNALPVSPVSPAANQTPLSIDLAGEPANVSLERVRDAELLDVVDAIDVDTIDDDVLADRSVLPLNSRDVIDGPSQSDTTSDSTSDKPIQLENGHENQPANEQEPVPTEAARAVDLSPIESAVQGSGNNAQAPMERSSPLLQTGTDEIDRVSQSDALQAAIPATKAEASAAELEDIEADVLGLAPAKEHDAKHDEQIYASAIHDEPQPHSSADLHAHEPALLHESDEIHDDHHSPIEPPGVEAAAVPQSVESRELAALQARIRQALEDPSTMARQPLLAETPDAPAPKLSEAGRRARTIAELLESNEEFEEAAERESEAIALPVAEADIAAPEIETDESIAASDAAERSMAAGYDVPAAAALPPLEPIIEPPAPAIDLDEEESRGVPVPEDRTEDGPALEENGPTLNVAATANVVEAAGPAALAELIREADAGTPTAPPDVAADAGELSLAAGESAVMGDEEELVSAAPAVDDLAIEATAAAASEPHSDANDDALAKESANGTVSAAPQATDVIDLTEASSSQSAVSPIAEGASDEIIEVPAPAAKGRRGRKLPAAPSDPPAPKVRKATPTRKPPRGKKGAEVVAEVVAEAPEIDPNLAAAAALVASEAQNAIDPAAAALASNVEAATENELQVPPPSTPAGETEWAAVESRVDDLDTFADRVADAGREALEFQSQAKSDPEASFVEPPEPPVAGEIATSIGSGDDHTAGIVLDAGDVIESMRADFASESTLIRDTVDASDVSSESSPDQSTTIEIETDSAIIVPLEASVQASLTQAGTASLDAIAGAAQPETLQVDEIIVPSQLAAEPDELQTVIDDERAPVEADAPNAGEAIMTSPVVIDEVEIELVAPMFDPDPGTIAEREALDTKSAPSAIVEDEVVGEIVREIVGEIVGEAVVVLDKEESEDVDEVAAIDLVASRPLRGEDAELNVDGELEEASVDLAFTDHSAAADAVAPALEIGNAAEIADDSVQNTAGLDVEAIAEQGIESAAESSVSFVSLEDALDADVLPEALAISGESYADTIQEATPATVEGAWLDRGDATVADALATVMSDTVTDSPDVIVERLSENVSDTSAFDLVGPADGEEAADSLVMEPAPLAGSTLSTGQTLSLDLEAAAEDERTDNRPDVLGRIGPATIDRDEPADAPKPVPAQSVMVRGNPPPSTSVVNVNVPSMEELETTFQDAFAEALAMAAGAEAKRPDPQTPQPKPPAISTRPPAPKWELDESLLEQAEANAELHSRMPHKDRRRQRVRFRRRPRS